MKKVFWNVAGMVTSGRQTMVLWARLGDVGKEFIEVITLCLSLLFTGVLLHVLQVKQKAGAPVQNKQCSWECKAWEKVSMEIMYSLFFPQQ